jgi:hypothetical protein
MANDGYSYIMDTTHGEHHFTTPVHHEDHPGGPHGWMDELKHDLGAVIDTMQKVSSTVVNLLGIYESVNGRKGKRVTFPKKE